MNVNEFKVGPVLSTSFSVWLKNLIPFSVIATIFYAPAIGYGWWVANNLFTFTRMEAITHPLLLALLFLCLGYAVTGVLVYGVFQQIRGRHPGIGECIASGFKRLPPVMGVVLLSMLIVLGVAALLLAPVYFVPALGILLGPIALVVVIVMYMMLYVSVPAAVIERPGVVGALKRSKELTAGMKGRIFSIVFVLGVLSWVADKIVQVAVGAGTDLASSKTALLVGLGFDILLGILGSVTAAVVYHELRQAKEGVGIEELAQVFD